ncbi:Hypothetical_protein [Hexamita inflata]|uniref:Hypothetical_protein n=1 Tax=Hexamita inflata TaxID=28002 RepID=A0AA86UKP1_9EUKA|nr:Hypothetical protein HINF_LOCUS42901 [Hexamita inflata]
MLMTPMFVQIIYNLIILVVNRQLIKIVCIFVSFIVLNNKQQDVTHSIWSSSAAKLQSRMNCFLFVNNECSFFSSYSLSRGAFGNASVRVLIGYVDDKVLK